MRVGMTQDKGSCEEVIRFVTPSISTSSKQTAPTTLLQIYL